MKDFLTELKEFAEKELKSIKEQIVKILTDIGPPVTIDMEKLFNKLLTSLKNKVKAS